MAHELDPFVGPEFMARVRLDNSGIDRLYKIDINGQVTLWDGSSWEDLGNVNGDVYLYDKELDELGDSVEKTHVMVDPESAVVISAFLQERPFQPVKLDEIDPEETRLMAAGLAEEDFTMIDRVITAAGESPTDVDGNYTPEERSKLASSQPRNADGEFVKVGSRVVVAGDTSRGSGTLESIDYENNKVNVRLDTGKLIAVDSKYTQGEENVDAPMMVPSTDNVPMDFSGILGEPRTPKSFIAQLPGSLPTLTDKDLYDLMYNYPSFVEKQRNSYKLQDDSPKVMKAYDKKRIEDRYGKTSLAASAAEDDSINSPKESDVTAKYLAIVSPDDNGAVMDVVALVPESKTSKQPSIYERREGKWQKNDQILIDHKSAPPPPVVPLHDHQLLHHVPTQDHESSPITSTGYALDLF